MPVINQNNSVFDVANETAQNSFKQINSILQGMGKSTFEEMTKIFPDLKYSKKGGFVSFRSKPVPMNNMYTLELGHNRWIILQFDEANNILQNALDIDLELSFDELKKYFSKNYQSYENFNRSEYEAMFKVEIKFENHQEFLENNRDNLAIFKKGDTLIVVSLSNPENGRPSIFYRNSNYIPTLKAKYEKLYGPLPAHE